MGNGARRPRSVHADEFAQLAEQGRGTAEYRHDFLGEQGHRTYYMGIERTIVDLLETLNAMGQVSALGSQRRPAAPLGLKLRVSWRVSPVSAMMPYAFLGARTCNDSPARSGSAQADGWPEVL